MHFLIFSAAGILFLFIGIYLKKKNNEFNRNSEKAKGRICDIVETTMHSKDALGNVVDTHCYQSPVVEYIKNNKRYQFKAKVDAKQKNIKIGQTVGIYINKENHKIAKMIIGQELTDVVLTFCILLGTISLSASVLMFDPSIFNLRFVKNPFIMGAIFISGLFIYLKFGYLLTAFKSAPLYTENAQEMDEM